MSSDILSVLYMRIDVLVPIVCLSIGSFLYVMWLDCSLFDASAVVGKKDEEFSLALSCWPLIAIALSICD